MDGDCGENEDRKTNMLTLHAAYHKLTKAENIDNYGLRKPKCGW